jgi:hypothetical protein
VAFAAVQRKGKGTSGASVAIGAGDGWATPSAGNLLVVTANSDALVTITNIGTAWTAGPSVVDGNGTYFWWKISQGTESTITCTPSVSDTICITVAEYSGNAASPFDVSNSSTIAGTSGTTTTSTSVNTTAAGDLIVAAACLHIGGAGSGTNTAPSWTNSFTNQLTATSGGSGSTDVTTFYAELVAGAAGAYSTSASWTGNAADRQQLIVAFTAAATASATYPPQRPRSRTAAPLRVARTRETTPVRAQINPPIPVQEVDQTRRLRGMFVRRGEVRNVVAPQFNPPIPVQEVDQPRRVRGLRLRRGDVFSPPWVGAQPAQPPAFVPDRTHRTRLLAVSRRGRIAPPPAADLPVSGAKRDRPLFPAYRRARPPQLLPLATDVAPGAKRDRPNLPASRRGRAGWVPLVGAPPPPPPAFAPGVIRHRARYGFPRRGRYVNPVLVCDCTVHRPSTGIITRPNSGTVTRPDTGIVQDPCC